MYHYKKKTMKKILLISAIAAIAVSCKDELNVPLSELSSEQVSGDPTALDSFLISAYAILDDPSDRRRWTTSPSDWVFGSVASDDAYKGSEEGDQGDVNQIERYEVLNTNPFFDNRWRQLYAGINRSNTVIKFASDGLANGILEEKAANEIIGEARFLRGHYHFEARTMFKDVPFVDENATESVSNDEEIWEDIEADFAFAAANMDVKPKEEGRASAWSAKAYLAKTHMYQLDYAAAKPVLEDIISSGPYSLNAKFHDNFSAATNNSLESVFAVQYAVNQTGTEQNQDLGNYGDLLNFPHGDNPFGCCGFHQPSHDLVNAYLVDETTGLPFVNTSITNPEMYVKNVDVNDLVDAKPRNANDSTFVPEARPLDPRLDWTVGRRGIPFLGWGDFGVEGTWIRDEANGGPYAAKKHIWEKNGGADAGGKGPWGQNVSAVNTNIIRFAEVLLWRAEVAASESDLGMAAMYVDMLRERANNPEGRVKKADGTDAANYMVGLYRDNGGFPDQDFAFDAILYEHRLEMALEGHRFFELVRLGKAESVINTYLGSNQFRSYLEGKTFNSSNSYYPIPQSIIDLSGGKITQK